VDSVFELVEGDGLLRPPDVRRRDRAVSPGPGRPEETGPPR
jgi:hypothetical protein